MRLYPMLRNMRVTSLAGTARVKVPSSLMLVPVVVPCTATWPVVMGALLSESVTLPVRIRVCPDTDAVPPTSMANATDIANLNCIVLSPFSDEGINTDTHGDAAAPAYRNCGMHSNRTAPDETGKLNVNSLSKSTTGRR